MNAQEINKKLGVELVTTFLGDIVCKQFTDKEIKQYCIEDLVQRDLEGRCLLTLRAVKIIRELKNEK